MADGGERYESLRRRIEEIETLASPPASLDRILALASNAEAKVDDLAGAIRIDPAIAARVLRLANSAYFGFSRRVESVDEAIMVVGFRNVRNLAACAVVAPVFAEHDGAVDRAALWRHSCGVAEAARLLAAHQSGEDGVAYISGLLHDLGQVVLDETLGEEYARAVEKPREGGSTLQAREQRALGVDHAWAGAALCEHWRLSPTVVEAIRFHHDPDPADDRGADAARVAFAELLAEREGLGDALDPSGPAELPEALLGRLGLRAEDVDTLAEALRERSDAIDLLYRESLGVGA